MRKYLLLALVTAFLVTCASNSPTVRRRTSETEEIEENLGTETGLASKKAKIQKLQEELQSISTQIDERQRLLEELNNIKNVIDTDTLIEEGYNMN